MSVVFLLIKNAVLSYATQRGITGHPTSNRYRIVTNKYIYSITQNLTTDFPILYMYTNSDTVISIKFIHTK